MMATCAIVKMKLWVKGADRGSRDHFGEFWDPLLISATAEATNSKFGMQNDRDVSYRKKMKIWVKRGR